MEQASNVPHGTIHPDASTSEASEESAALSAGQYLDKALNLIGKKMRNAATLVRERSPREGASKSALESASNVLDATGRYMMRERVLEDAGGVVRKYPLRSVGVCFLVGFLAGSVGRVARR